MWRGLTIVMYLPEAERKAVEISECISGQWRLRDEKKKKIR